MRQYQPSDAGFLWAAYRRGAFGMREGLSQSEFLEAMAERLGNIDLIWIVEDENRNFRAGRGQIAIVTLTTDGWSVSPRAYVMPWATPLNVLRGMVAFFHMIRYQKDVGVCLVKATEAEAKQLRRMSRYGVLFPRGRIPFGLPTGDAFIFSIDGKKATENVSH